MTDLVMPTPANDQVPEQRTPHPDPFLDTGCDACPEPYIESARFAEGSCELRIPTCGAVSRVGQYDTWRQMVSLARHRLAVAVCDDGSDECQCSCCRDAQMISA